jgi:threonine synthase
VAIRRRAAQRHVVVVDPHTAAAVAVAADMGGNTALDFSA